MKYQEAGDCLLFTAVFPAKLGHAGQQQILSTLKF